MSRTVIPPHNTKFFLAVPSIAAMQILDRDYHKNYIRNPRSGNGGQRAGVAERAKHGIRAVIAKSPRSTISKRGHDIPCARSHSIAESHEHDNQDPERKCDL